MDGLKPLSGKVAVISGSSSGIGAAIARELSMRGAHVVVNYPFPNLKAQAQAVVNNLPTSGIVSQLPATECSRYVGGHALGFLLTKRKAVEADIGSTSGPGILADAAAEKYGQIDILVNNAALAINLPLEEQTLKDWDRLVNLNGRGTFLLTKATLKHLSKESSRIINIVSVSSRGPPPFQTIYAGTKGMQDSFTRCWAKELPRKYGCTVNAVSPGPTKTEGFLDAGPEMMKTLQPIINQTPVAPRMGEPSEIAFTVAMLADPRASWMNGVHICVDGGLFID